MMTKFWYRPLALAAATVVVGVASDEALATNQTGHASAHIVQAINVVENKQMNFGYIIPPSGGGPVTLTTGNTISGAGFTFSGTTVPGQFTATGSAGELVTVSFSNNDTLTDTLGTHTMTLSNYTNNAAATFSGTLGSGPGTVTFDVGATLNVGANQAGGSYSGTYTVTVDY